MKIIRDLLSTEQISDPAIRKLVQQRIDELGGEKFDSAELGFFLVVDPGDSLVSIGDQLGFPVLANRVTGIKFGEPGFAPSFEFVEAIGNCYDIVFIVDDTGFGVELFVPVAEGVPVGLLAMCELYATSGQI